MCILYEYELQEKFGVTQTQPFYFTFSMARETAKKLGRSPRAASGAARPRGSSMRRTAVVIGGTGHVGSYLCPRLAEDGSTRVVCISRGNREPYPARDDGGSGWECVERLTLDRAADAAAFAKVLIELQPTVIVDMICFTEEECRALVEPLVAAQPAVPLALFIHIGSIWSYGPSIAVPTTEAGPHAEPLGEYGRQKRRIEQYLLQANTPWPSTVLHPGHIVGRGWAPLNPQGNFDPRCFQTLRAGDELVIPNLGSESVHHVHADDIASAILAAIASPSAAAGQAFSIVSAQALPLRGFAQLLVQKMGWPSPPRLECVPCPSAAFDSLVASESAAQTLEHISHSPCCSVGKLERVLGFRPAWSSVDAVAEAVRWLEASGELDGSGWYPGKVEMEHAPGDGLLHRRLAQLRERGPDEYLEKDLLKAVGATSLIGQGGTGSSTERYVAAAGDLANVAEYDSSARVFVSANGDRPGRVPVVNEHGSLHGAYANLAKVVAAGAVVVADTARYRDDDAYNVGERELARWLEQNGYYEPNPGSGYWISERSALWWEECRIEEAVSPATGKPIRKGTQFYHCPSTGKSQWNKPDAESAAPIIVRDPNLPRLTTPPL